MFIFFTYAILAGLHYSCIRTIDFVTPFVVIYLSKHHHHHHHNIFSELRKDNISDLDRVLGLCRSHINLTAKNILLIKVMDEVRTLYLVFILVHFSFFSLFLILSVVILTLTPYF
jgi:hypothetical protein